MKRLLIVIAALTCATNVNAENLIRWLLTRDVKKSDFYVYRPEVSKPSSVSTKSKYVPMTESEIKTAKIAIQRHEARIINKAALHADNKPIKRVIDKHRESDEQGAHAVSRSKQIMYGAGSPMRDDGVIQAWREAEEAQRRLENHRTYMEQVRQSRKVIEQTKSISGKVNQTP